PAVLVGRHHPAGLGPRSPEDPAVPARRLSDLGVPGEGPRADRRVRGDGSGGEGGTRGGAGRPRIGAGGPGAHRGPGQAPPYRVARRRSLRPGASGTPARTDVRTPKCAPIPGRPSLSPADGDPRNPQGPVTRGATGDEPQ